LNDPGHNGATPISSPPTPLADFTADRRVLYLSSIAFALGLLGAVLALVLLRLIALFTNLFFFQRISVHTASPQDAGVGAFMLLIPVLGATIVGLMARYGSERIRGHGIPEAIEAILINGSRVQPKVAVLKPLSAAISIGSGGPFGAEGPIIMTAGSFGSLVAQLFHLSSSERKTLLVAGAAAGMSATFASPVAAVLLAVELLLFEWKPRSLIPVAVASLTAFMLRHYLIGAGPLFPVRAHPAFVGVGSIVCCLFAGLCAGALSALLTSMVYASEDAFGHLPIHWMWWPPIGAVSIGIGGLFFPRALGVGYDTIGALLQGNLAVKTIIGVLIVKSLIWSISLGSGTSGGVLAPLLMMGGALGGLLALFLPDNGAGFWELVCMAAVLGGAMRSPFTSVIFALELTHDMNMLVPLLAGVIVAHAFTVLTLKRSILTEKVSRRGFHLSREYSVDPLELHFAREVMRPVLTLQLPAAPGDIEAILAARQEIVPVVDQSGALVAVASGADIRDLASASDQDAVRALDRLSLEGAVCVAAGEPLRAVAHRLAEAARPWALVVRPHEDGDTVAGIIEVSDLLKAFARNVEAERLRARHLQLRLRLRPAGDDGALAR
jgi:CIC family chloride channel protein